MKCPKNPLQFNKQIAKELIKELNELNCKETEICSGQNVKWWLRFVL